MRYLLDTNICIYISKQKPPQVLSRLERTDPELVSMSTITYGELCFGAQKSSQFPKAMRNLAELTENVPVVPLDPTVANHYGRLRHHLQRLGTPISNNDLWIAAHCLQLGYTLVTNNVREFERVPDLNIEDWTS